MTLKEKLADDFAHNLLPPNQRHAKVAWLKGFKAAKILIISELAGVLPISFLDKIADAGEDFPTPTI